jgi:hypothetical protein
MNMTNVRDAPHTLILYVLIVLLAAVLIYTGLKVFPMTKESQGTWQCNAVSCSKFINPQEWVSKNCARSILPNGTDYVACTVNLNGVNTSVPLSVINLTFVSQQCEIVTCVQEVNIRPANYTVPVLG